MNAFLDSLSPDLREVIQATGTKVAFQKGDTVFERGETGEAMYVVLSGGVRVHDGDLLLNTLGEGEIFGEIAGLGGTERTATIIADEDVKLLRVEKEALFDAVLAEPPVLRGLVKMLCERESGMADRMTRRSWKLHAAEQELEIGRRIQSGFLPESLPAVPGYELAAHFQAARVVAGDFYDAFMLPSMNRTALVIGDVCDKGVGAALFMTLFRSLIRATAQARKFLTWAVDSDPAAHIPSGKDVAELVRETLANTVALTNNYVAVTHGKTSMFASVFIGLLDPDTGELSYINAGHEEAYIVGKEGIRAKLEPTGPVVGIFAGAQHGIAASTLEPGETLLTYSDGVPEATNEAGEQFTSERLENLLNESKGRASELIDSINAALGDFTHGAGQHDDITLLAASRLIG
jgi:sigma-B regulation protein RsbU (phosphoserine phosphatase)